MVYDCFQFNNELDILEIRLNELNEFVDKFVLVESTVKHVNKPKPLYFRKNIKRFEKFKNKIIHIVVEDSPDVNLAWIINDYQFSSMSRGLTNCRNNDVIIFGDLDEIPRAEAVRNNLNKPGKLKIFEQALSFYYLNCVEYSIGPWLGTRMTTYKYFRKYKTPWIAKFSKFDVRIPNGGWHLSYIGDVKWIQEKLVGMAHQEFNNDKYNTPENIRLAVAEGRDFLGMGRKFQIVDLNKLPKYIQEHKGKFKEHIAMKLVSDTPAYSMRKKYLNFKGMLRIVYRKMRKIIKDI